MRPAFGQPGKSTMPDEVADHLVQAWNLDVGGGQYRDPYPGQERRTGGASRVRNIVFSIPVNVAQLARPIVKRSRVRCIGCRIYRNRCPIIGSFRLPLRGLVLRPNGMPLTGRRSAKRDGNPTAGWVAARGTPKRSLERRTHHFHMVRLHERPIRLRIHTLPLLEHLLEPTWCHTN